MDYEPKPQPETLDAAIANTGVTYTAVFVPFSQSRNTKQTKKPSDYSLNWKVTVSKGAHTLTSDYSQGIAYIPGYKQTWHGRMTQGEFDAIAQACETGKANLNPHGVIPRVKTIPAPELRDVMHALILDADVLNYSSFEEWARAFGYDSDSREAERIYKACLEIALKLRAMLGDSGLTALQEAAQDY